MRSYAVFFLLCDATGKREDELRRRYSIQLDYYAMALSQITGLKVKEKVIYSFALGRSLTVE